MNLLRNEIRTGLLVVFTLAGLVCLLLYLGSPGVFVSQKVFRIYYDNASGLEPGAPVLLAGRKIGLVSKLYSPVPENERPKPKLETLVEVQVAKSANIYAKVKVQIAQPSLLGKPVIDFTNGEEASGLAQDGTTFLGERQPGLADAVPSILEKLDPVLTKATATLGSLQKTADNLGRITAEKSDLSMTLAEFKKLGFNLTEITGHNGSLNRSLQNIETLTGDDGKFAKSLDHIADLTSPEGDLSKTLSHAEKFTSDLADNKDVPTMLRNFRRTSEKLESEITRLSSQLTVTAGNLEQATDTLKRQPWRLIWPTTKKYEGPNQNIQTTPTAKMKTTRN